MVVVVGRCVVVVVVVVVEVVGGIQKEGIVDGCVQWYTWVGLPLFVKLMSTFGKSVGIIFFH